MNYNCAAALQTRSLGVFGASPHRNLSPRISGHPALEFLTASPTLQPRKNQYVKGLSLKKKTNPESLNLLEHQHLPFSAWLDGPTPTATLQAVEARLRARSCPINPFQLKR